METMLYKSLFLVCMLLVSGVQVCICADSPGKRRLRVKKYVPRTGLTKMSSPKRQSACAVSAIRDGLPEQYTSVLAAIDDPLKKLSYFDADLGKGCYILPTKLCLDAIFDRPEGEKYTLIEAFDRHLLQRYPGLLAASCHRNVMPFVYAQSKLTNENRTQAFVPHLFSLLARNALQESDFLHPTVIQTAALYLMQGDRDWYLKARDIIVASPGIVSHLNHALTLQGQLKVVDTMLMHERPSQVASLCVKTMYAYDRGLAYQQLLRLVEHPIFTGSPDARFIQNDLLLWCAETGASPLMVDCLLKHAADPYCPQNRSKGVITPIESALEIVLANPSHPLVLKNFAALLQVPKEKSAFCCLQSNADFYEETRDEMKDMIGEAFKAQGLAPFAESFCAWESILASMCTPEDLSNARIFSLQVLMLQNLEAQKSMSLLDVCDFDQFLRAMHIEKFCRLIARTLRTEKAADLDEFLRTGRAIVYAYARLAPAYQEKAQSIYATLNPDTQKYIDAIPLDRCDDIDHFVANFCGADSSGRH
jgi:hypothetical protein